MSCKHEQQIPDELAEILHHARNAILQVFPRFREALQHLQLQVVRTLDTHGLQSVELGDESGVEDFDFSTRQAFANLDAEIKGIKGFDEGLDRVIDFSDSDGATGNRGQDILMGKGITLVSNGGTPIQDLGNWSHKSHSLFLLLPLTALARCKEGRNH